LWLRSAQYFGGEILTNVHVHFESKSAAALSEINLLKKDDSDAEVSYAFVKEHRNSQRVCYALLRCAAQMPAKSVSGLAASLVEKITETAKKSIEIRNLDDNDDSCNIEEEFDFNLSPHIALLCLWGKTDDVCAFLSKSIRRAFVDDDGEDADAGAGADALEEPKKKGSKKRKQKVSERSERASLEEEEHTRDGSREMAADTQWLHPLLTNIIPLNSFCSLAPSLLH